MNEFEIKVFKKIIAPIEIIDIVNISDEYNMREYGVNYFKVVCSFKYKDEIFNTYYGRIVNKKQSNSELLKEKINSEIESIEYFLYEDKGENGAYLSQFASFICHQIEISKVKNEEVIEDYLEKLRDEVKEIIREGKENKISNLQIHKNCINLYKNL